MGGDSTVFVAEVDKIEAVRSNQKISELALKYSPSAIAAAGNVVAVGGEVRIPPCIIIYMNSRAIRRTRKYACTPGTASRSRKAQRSTAQREP